MKQGIDIKIFGLTGDMQDINAEVYAILDKCFTHISAGKKTVNKSGVLAYLVEEIEAHPVITPGNYTASQLKLLEWRHLNNPSPLFPSK